MSNIRLFYPENIIDNSTSLLSKEHTHYVVNVMRLKRGSNLNFFNKNGEWKSEIVFLDKDRVEVKFLNKVKEPSSSLNIELAICLVKKNPMETILQKATELGVSKITPIISERTEVKELNYERAKKIVVEATEQSNQLSPPEISNVIKLKDFLNKLKKPINISNIELAICLVKKSPMETILQKATELGVSKIIPIISERTEVKEINHDRAKKIVIEATEQSNQMVPPQILNAVALKDFLQNLDRTTKLLFADVNSKKHLKNENFKDFKSLCILIGPEGDFSPSERESILSISEVIPFTISKNILRSDTAVISAISLVNLINNHP